MDNKLTIHCKVRGESTDLSFYSFISRAHDMQEKDNVIDNTMLLIGGKLSSPWHPYSRVC